MFDEITLWVRIWITIRDPFSILARIYLVDPPKRAMQVEWQWKRGQQWAGRTKESELPSSELAYPAFRQRGCSASAMT